MAKTTKKAKNPDETQVKFYFSHKTGPFRFRHRNPGRNL